MVKLNVFTTYGYVTHGYVTHGYVTSVHIDPETVGVYEVTIVVCMSRPFSAWRQGEQIC